MVPTRSRASFVVAVVSGTAPRRPPVKNIQEWRQTRGEHVTAMRAITAKAAAETRNLTPEEQTEWEKLDKAQDALRAQIVREERQLELDRELASKQGTPAADPAKAATTATAAEKDAAYSRAFRSWAAGGVEALEPEERSIMSERRASLSAEDIKNLPPRIQKELRAQGVATGGAGGYTVPTGFSGVYEKALKSYSGVMQAARILDTETGNDLPWPTVNDTAQVGEQLGENVQAAAQDVTFGVVTLKAYKFSSKLMLCSIELLQDSAFDIEALLGELAAERIGRILNQRFTTGTGTAQPNGVVTAATSGFTLPVGNTLLQTWAGLNALEASVDPAYRPGSAYMMNDTTFQTIKGLVDTTGRPLWQPLMTGSLAGQIGQGTLNGYPVYINQDMAVPAANAKTVLFGRFDKYIVRRVRDIFVFRFAEKYMDFGQIGFLAFARYDGNLLNAGTNPIKYLSQSAT
jgi:HK97 family phage major capsid protein